MDTSKACSLLNPSSQTDFPAVSVWREGRVEPVLQTHLIRRQEEWPLSPILGAISRNGCTTNPARRVTRLLRFLAQGCRSNIDAHGGRLWADANEPRGAVFQFTLPVGSLGAGV